MQFQSTMWTMIDGAKGGDEAAVREFVLRYRAPVVAFCTRRGFGPEAEDLAQEVFIRLFTDGVLLHADRDKGRFRSLVLAVTRHVIGHHAERATAQKRGGGKVCSLGDIDVAAEPGDDEFDREWMAHLLTICLARLASEHPNYHEALRRFLIEGQSYAEIAQVTGQPPGRLKNHIYRGKAKLVAYLRDEVREYALSHSEYAEELQMLSRFLPDAP